jgi:hypothetical protein
MRGATRYYINGCDPEWILKIVCAIDIFQEIIDTNKQFVRDLFFENLLSGLEPEEAMMKAVHIVRKMRRGK